MSDIFFYYSNGKGYSGQRFASKILIDGLKSFKSKEITYNVDSNFVFQFFEAIYNAVYTYFHTKDVKTAHINLGQSLFSIFKFSLSLLVLRSKNIKTIVSLHGSLFTTWDRKSILNRLFIFFLNRSNFVTVLGPNQKRILEEQINGPKVIIMNNTCLEDPLVNSFINRKQGTDGPISVIFLSNLIPSKGFLDFIESIKQIDENDLQVPIEVILCGPFTNEADRRNYEPMILKEIADINIRKKIKMRWVMGAFGSQKSQLLENAHIFVMPTKYPIEAQPISLIEAMAKGNAIVAYAQGEIPFMLDNRAIVIEKHSVLELKSAIIKLVNNRDYRVQMALDLSDLYFQRYAKEVHLQKWEDIIKNQYENLHY